MSLHLFTFTGVGACGNDEGPYSLDIHDVTCDACRSAGRSDTRERMATKDNPGKFDCYANAKPDEPMFVLLARDKGAPALVRLWATEREMAGERPEKVAEARECAAAMERWRRQNVVTIKAT